MARYEIVGLYDCPWLAKADKLIDEIQCRFPSIEFKKTLKDKAQWKDFVDEMKKLRGWEITKSPVIWQTLARPKGKANLIGDINEFSEFVLAFFGVKYCENNDVLLDQIVLNKAMFATGLGGKEPANKTICNLALINAPMKMLEAVLGQLLSPVSIISPNLLFNIKVYDEKTSVRNLDGLEMEVYDMASANLFKFSVVYTLSEIFYDTHIIIILEDLSRRVEEDVGIWLTRVEWSIKRYADILNHSNAENYRIIIGGDGPQCYMAEMLRKFLSSKKVKSYHIVAVGQHVITRAKGLIGRKCDVAGGTISRLHAWGWPGLTGAYVEVHDAVLKDSNSSIRGPSPCEIPLGEIALNPEWLYNDFSGEFLKRQREQIFRTRAPTRTDMCMAEAVINTLHVWLMSSSAYGPIPGYQSQSDCCRPFWNQKVKKEKVDANTENIDLEEEDVILPVICAGVKCSKKSSFPRGTFMVQPAVCYYGKWVPAGKISEKTHNRILKEVNKLWSIRQEMICRDSNIDGLFPDYDIMTGKRKPEPEPEEEYGELEGEDANPQGNFFLNSGVSDGEEESKEA